MKALRKNRTWIFAFAVSIVFHAALIFLVPSFAPKQPNSIIRVRLAELPPKASVSESSSAPKAAPAPKAAVKKAVVPKPKRAEKKEAPVKPAPAAEISKTPTEAVQSDETELTPTTQNTGGGDPDGSTGSSNGGNGSGTGAGSGSGSGQGTGILDVGSLTVTKRVAPEYPIFSRKRGEQGTAVLIIVIENGSVADAYIEKSSGFERLDSAAKKAVLKWKFLHSGRVRARVPITFRLQ